MWLFLQFTLLFLIIPFIIICWNSIHPFSISYPKFGHYGARLSAISQMSLLPGPSRDPTMLPTQTIYIFSAESCKFTQGLLSTGCAWETTKRNHTGSMIINSLDHLSWVLLKWRSYNSTPRFLPKHPEDTHFSCFYPEVMTIALMQMWISLQFQQNTVFWYRWWIAPPSLPVRWSCCANQQS